MSLREINGIEVWQSELLSAHTEIVHGFTGRKGGVSEGEYASLSMSPRRGDNPESVRRNEEILCRAMGLSHERLTSTRQEHTDEVAVIESGDIGMGIIRPWDRGVDAVITRLSRVPLLAYAADCVPILLYAPSIGAIAAVHSGWRGTEMKIVKKTVEKLTALGADADKIEAAIGPAIGKCCYEVSEDVALRFPEECRTDKGGGKYMLDLVKANVLILREAGVCKIDSSAPCTKCNNDTFFSHRGQMGKSGTLGAVIELK